MKVYVLTRTDKVETGVDSWHVDVLPITERTVVGVFPSRQEAMSEGYAERHWRGADDYDVEEFDL